MAGTLYVVATPLGNLEDMTFRAVRVLREVALIAAEDTRHSRKLLAHFDIRTRLTSYFDHVERQKAPRLVERLRAGESIAVICDAGTPGIADPGYRLVRAALDAGVRVVPVPGASAIMAALCAGGLPTDRFVFEGFVPARSAARRTFYTALRDESRTIVCFEAGRRLLASLRDLAAEIGPRPVVVAREMTKVFEELVRAPAPAVAEQLQDAPVRGEVTLLIGGAVAASGPNRDDLHDALNRLLESGTSLREAAKRLAHEHGWSRREVYQAGLALQRAGKGSGDAR